MSLTIDTPLDKGARVSAANTARDGTGTIVPIFTAGPRGARIDRIGAVAEGTTTAGMLRLFVRVAGQWRLLAEITVSAITASGTVPAWRGEWIPSGGILTLPRGVAIGAATHNAEAFILHAEGGQFA
jgi:hypothetical protein